MDPTPATALTSSGSSLRKPAETTQTGLISSDFETFLTMLTTQLKHQDPLNPLDSSEFAVQLATFSGVEQQARSNDLLEGLGGRLDTMNLSQMAGWIGMEARADGPALFAGQPLELAPEFPQNTQSAELVVRNAAGQEVQRLALDPDQPQVFWAGVSDDGRPFNRGEYAFTLEASTASGPRDPQPVATWQTVREVRSSLDGPVLVLASGQSVSAALADALRDPGR